MTRWCLLAALTLALARAAHALPITVAYGDADGQGFFDPTLGAARRAAFEFAAQQWAATLAGTVPITIAATMESLGGAGDAALLASAAPSTLHRNFGAASDVWYGAALANQLAGRDLNGADTPEISIVFNADVDGPEVLGSIAWYYGTDAQPDSDVDFVTIALHELGHGLNFFDTFDPTSGGWQTPNDRPGIFDDMLRRPRVGDFTALRDTERLAAAISPPLLWVGPSLTAFNGGAAAVFTPDPFASGASLSHWDPLGAPGELMGPSYSGAVHDPGLLLPALVDMGWQLAVASPTPRATPPPTATPTATFRPTATPQPAGTPPPRRDAVYVSNFDDATLSVIDDSFHVRTTIAVADGPLGVAASADGRRVFVTHFGAGLLSVLSTRTNRVLATVAVGQSAEGIALTPDGAWAAVTDTAADQAVIVDVAARTVRARVPTGRQPAAVAMAPDGSVALVADYGEAAVAVIDLVSGLRRAILPMEQSAVVGVALASGTGTGFAAFFLGGSLMSVDATALTSASSPYTPTARNEAVAMAADGSIAYVAGHAADGSQGQVVAIDTVRQQIVNRAATGDLPMAVALSSDGRNVFVANAGSNSVSRLSVHGLAAGPQIPVGASPMGLAVSAVPVFCDGDCNGDGAVTVDEVVQAVAIALGQQAVTSCVATDRDDDGDVTIDEILAAVNHALDRCPR